MTKSAETSLMLMAAMAMGGVTRPKFDNEYQELKELKRTPKIKRDSTRILEITEEMKRLKV